MANITIRLENNDKQEFARICEKIGLSVSTAFNVFVKSVIREEKIPFENAAEIGTQKVINEHSTIGLVVTTDGTISEIPRESYIQAEERVIRELKELNKPFAVLLNSSSKSQKSFLNTFFFGFV